MATTGPKRVEHASDARRNVGDIERLISVVGGSALAVAGMRKRGIAGTALALLGAEMIRRGATGRCFVYDAMGVSTADGSRPLSVVRARHDLESSAATVDARYSIKVEQTITIKRPADELYAFWRDFRNHPRFMPRLQSVEILDSMRSRWTMALPGGQQLSWTSEIVVDRPNDLISWKTVGNSDIAQAGSVHFSARGTSSTEVRVVLDYEPVGGRPGRALSQLFGVAPEQLIREQLEKFKSVTERGELVLISSQSGQTAR